MVFIFKYPYFMVFNIQVPPPLENCMLFDIQISQFYGFWYLSINTSKKKFKIVFLKWVNIEYQKTYNFQRGLIHEYKQNKKLGYLNIKNHKIGIFKYIKTYNLIKGLVIQYQNHNIGKFEYKKTIQFSKILNIWT